MQWKSRPVLTLGLAALALTLGLAALAAGCRSYLEPPKPPPHQGAVVRVACPAPVAALVRAHSRAWASRQDARVEVVEYATDRTPDQVDQGDLWIVRPAELPRWAAAGKLRQVPDALTGRGEKFDWNGLLPLYREQLLVWDKQPFGLPLVGEAPVCLYRADLFESKGLAAKFRAWQGLRRANDAPPVEFRPPASWQEFATLAEFFRQHHPPGKPGPSLPPLPSDPAALDRLFYQAAAPFARRAIPQDEAQGREHLAEVFAFHYDLATGKPRVQTAGFVAALDLLARLQASRPPAPAPSRTGRSSTARRSSPSPTPPCWVIE